VIIFRKVFLGLIVIAGFSLNTAYAEAKLAVMDYQAVLFNSVAAGDATLQLREALAGAQGLLDEIKNGIESRQNSLKVDAEILTEDEIAKFQQEIQEALAQRSQISAQMQQAQQKSRNEFINQYRPAIADLVSKHVEAQGYTLVIDSQAVLWNVDTPDISEEILSLFDAQYGEQKKQILEQQSK